MILPAPVLVTDSDGLDLCVDACLATDAIAVDTEFVRTDTFYPLLGLIQISDGEQVWLVDPLAIEDFGPLETLFSCPSVVKVFHSCSEDLEVLRHQLGLLPSPLFDTQVAAAFLGHGYSRGYSALMATVLDIHLDKHETRSDWLRRPLSDAQLLYAAEDVYFLIKAYRKLVTGLEDSGRSQWMAEDMADLLAAAMDPETPDTYYQRVKGSWKLSRDELALLRDLTSWREREARLKNRPRNRIVPDQVFLDLLRLKPARVGELGKVEGFHTGAVRRYGEAVLDILHGEPDTQDLELPAAPLDKSAKSALARVRQRLDSKAEALAMAVELLARKKDLEDLVRSSLRGAPVLPERLARGWRREVIGEGLLDALTEGADHGR